MKKNVIGFEEQIDFDLRKLYSESGYSRFKMGKFEEYELYSRNKDFIPSDSIITVTGANGRLLAMRPDITLSIVKYFRPEEKNKEKLFYSENIYRADKDGNYQELKQVGLECIGKITSSDVKEVLVLAAKSLRSISKNYILELSHMGFIQEMIATIPEPCKKDILDAISKKNPDDIQRIGLDYSIPESQINNLRELTTVYGNYKTVIKRLNGLSLTKKAKAYLAEMNDLAEAIVAAKTGGKINIDFSIVNNMTYYSGILFRGYVPGVAEGILSGGRYDGLMEAMSKGGGAIGFATYLDELSYGKVSRKTKKEDEYINIALPKGRLGNKIYDLFEAAGYSCPGIKEDNRKLVFENNKKKIRFFWVKPSDVSVYVERGTADIGACGKDIIEEYSPDIYEILDLNRGKCKMCIAAKKGFSDDTSKTLRVATKFPEIARKYFEGESRKIDIIELHGSIELAPILDMADVIVDIVETGKTIKENDLCILDEFLPISAKLIVNKPLFKFKNDRIKTLVESIEEVI